MDNDLIDEFDSIYPEVPNTKPVILPDTPLHAILPEPVKTNNTVLQSKINDLYYKMYVKFIHSKCPKDEETIKLNKQIIQLTKNYNESMGGHRKTKHKYRRHYKKTKKHYNKTKRNKRK
jgi:hypothetical protein